MYGLRIAAFADAHELPALWHTGRGRCKIDGWAGGLEWRCRSTHECWCNTAGWTVGAAAVIPTSSLPATGGAAAAARPEMERGGKWNAGAGNLFSHATSAPATASQPPSGFSYSWNLCRHRWPFTSAGFLPGDEPGGIGKYCYSWHYSHRRYYYEVARCDAFAYWLALAYCDYLSGTTIYYQCADEQPATFGVAACHICYHL